MDELGADPTADTVGQGAVAGVDVRAASRLDPGTVVDRYEITEYRGAGAMGVVYRARDRRLGREVALKLLKSGAPGTTQCGVFCALLVREAQTLARISHPNVISIHDVGDFKGCVYVAMEFIDGPTLTSWARRPGLTWKDRMAALRAAGAGLAAAHGSRIVHRDFKPDNVLMGGPGEVKVADFGVARSLSDLEPPADVGCGCGAPEVGACAIDPTAIVGTPRYMSPELFAGVVADSRSDQFAFAASAWEVLYGAPAFGGETIAELLAARASETLQSPPATDAPPEIADVLSRALRASPARRYASLADLLQRLEAVGAGD